MELELIEGQKTPVTLDSHWIFIESATGKIRFEIEATGEVFSLNQKALYKNTGLKFGRLLISGVGRLVFEHGTGEFVPPVEGQKLSIDNMPPLVLAANQKISADVTSMPAVVIDSLPSVELAGTPRIEILENQYVRIKSVPPIKISANQAIAIRVSTQHKSAEVNVFPHVIASDPIRRKLVIKAALSNVEPVLIGEYPLLAGEREVIDSTAELTLTCAAGGLVYLMEW